MEQVSVSASQQSVNQAAPSASAQHEARVATAGEYLDRALNLIGSTMRNAASLVKERAPREGAAKDAFESASRVLDKTGEYIQGHRPTDDMRGVVRSYPLRSIGLCFLVGLLAGSAFRSARR